MKKIQFLLMTAAIAVLMAGVATFTACDKDDDKKEDGTEQTDKKGGSSQDGDSTANVEVKIAGTQVANVGETYATLLCRFTKPDGGEFTQAEGEAIMKLNPQGGFCLVEGEGTPTIKDSTINCIETARQGGIMSGTFNNLKAGTKYTVRAWLTVDGTTINYGENLTFTTQGSSIALSLVATQAANVSDTYATVLCRLAKANGTALTQEELAEVMKQNPQGGFCLVEGESMPTVQNPVFNCIETARQGGIMSGTFNNLIQGTKYSVRAWLTINGSTLYGDKVTFTTNNNGGGGSTTIAGIEMVLVNGGTFTMGATAEQGSDYESNERPTHSVTLSSYYIGKYEVTVAQFREFITATNYQTDADKNGGSYVYKNRSWSMQSGVNWRCGVSGEVRPASEDNHPVVHVSWNDAVAYCAWLSQQTGKTYRLPTEAEWEFAARGGKQSQGYKYSGSNTIGNVAWYSGNVSNTTHPVGKKSPNELGIYDMSGNVWEWCSDWYGSYSSSAQTNPTGPSSGSSRVARGGGLSDYAQVCSVSNRYDDYPGSSNAGLGFRLALSL